MTLATDAKSTGRAMKRPLTLLLLGAGVNSLNRGVAALGTACVDNLSAVFPGARIIAGLSGLGEQLDLELPDRTVTLDTCWLHSASSLRTRSGIRHLRLMRQFRRVVPGLGTRWLSNRTLEQLLACDAVLDIAGGDSFASIYTPEGFAAQVAVKRLVLDMGKPLVLLPQTYGPFRDDSFEPVREIMRRSALVATRDVFGLDELRQLIGNSSDGRFLLCPDVAFTLRPMPVAEDAVPALRGDGPLIGLNVSGLLWDGAAHFGLRSDYRELTRSLVEWAMNKVGARLLLIPHVFRRGMHRPPDQSAGAYGDADCALSQELAAEARQRWGDRVAAVTQPLSAPQLKTIIGRCDFFIGARMHACIAGVSQAVPTITLAYSKKAAGVMGAVGAEDLVVDLREHDSAGAIGAIDAVSSRRQAFAAKLAASMPAAKQAVRHFFAVRLRQALESTAAV